MYQSQATQLRLTLYFSDMFSVFSSQRNCPLLTKKWLIIPNRYSKLLPLVSNQQICILQSFEYLCISNVALHNQLLLIINVQLHSLGTNKEMKKYLLGTDLSNQRTKIRHWLNLFVMHHFGFQSWFLINSCDFHYEFLMSVFRYQNYFLTRFNYYYVTAR